MARQLGLSLLEVMTFQSLVPTFLQTLREKSVYLNSVKAYQRTLSLKATDPLVQAEIDFYEAMHQIFSPETITVNDSAARLIIQSAQSGFQDARDVISASYSQPYEAKDLKSDTEVIFKLRQRIEESVAVHTTTQEKKEDKPGSADGSSGNTYLSMVEEETACDSDEEEDTSTTFQKVENLAVFVSEYVASPQEMSKKQDVEQAYKSLLKDCNDGTYELTDLYKHIEYLDWYQNTRQLYYTLINLQAK
jgi:hypothetical protein